MSPNEQWAIYLIVRPQRKVGPSFTIYRPASKRSQRAEENPATGAFCPLRGGVVFGAKFLPKGVRTYSIL
jgi:hypothetical protein